MRCAISYAHSHVCWPLFEDCSLASDSATQIPGKALLANPATCSPTAYNAQNKRRISYEKEIAWITPSAGLCTTIWAHKPRTYDGLDAVPRYGEQFVADFHQPETSLTMFDGIDDPAKMIVDWFEGPSVLF
jgi:hypothetical protein